MIRPFTCITLVLAACSGLYLYQTKHRAQLMDHEIARTLKAADVAWQRAGVLRAEYTLLNDPSRLADLAGQYLPNLQTTAPGQFSTWADLDKRLPPVGPPPAPPAPDTAPAVADASPPQSAEPVVARADPPHTDTARLDPPRAASTPVEPSHIQGAALPKPAPRPQPVPVRRVIEPSPIPLRVTQVAIRTEPRVPPAAQAVIRPLPAAPPQMVGSALGMARTMQPMRSPDGPQGGGRQ